MQTIGQPERAPDFGPAQMGPALTAAGATRILDGLEELEDLLP